MGERPFRATTALLVLVVAAAAAARLRLVDLPLERDEGEYAYAGRMLLEGVPPYRSVYTVKLPGAHLVHALWVGLLGPTVLAVRIGALVANAVTILLVHRFARRALEPPWALAAAASYAVLSNGSTMLGMAGHATHYVVLFALAGLNRLPGPGRPGSRRTFAAGLLLGCAVLMKQVGAFFLAYALWTLLADPRRRRSAGPLLAGAALPLAAVVAWLAASGVFGAFWFWTVEYAWYYGSAGALERLAPRLRSALLDVVLPAWPLWTLALAGLAGLRERHPTGLAGFALCSALAVAPGFHLRPHYFLVLAPALSVLVGAALARASEGRWRAAIPWVAALALAWPVFVDRDVLFRLDGVEASRRVYGANPFPESAEIARAVAARTDEGERIAILGSEPQILFLAGRRSATGYVYVYPLMEPQPLALRMQEEMIAEIESAAPRAIVDVDVEWSWLPERAQHGRILEWRRQYLEDHYEPVGDPAAPVVVYSRRE